MKDIPLDNQQIESQYVLFPFTVTIDDGYGAYEYKMAFPGDVAIRDLIKTLADKYEVQMPEGTFIKQEPKWKTTNSHNLLEPSVL